MKVGDKVMVPGIIYDDYSMRKVAEEREGIVVYIHSKHRFYTVKLSNGTTESFHFKYRVGDSRPDCGNRSRKY